MLLASMLPPVLLRGLPALSDNQFLRAKSDRRPMHQALQFEPLPRNPYSHGSVSSQRRPASPLSTSDLKTQENPGTSSKSRASKFPGGKGSIPPRSRESRAIAISLHPSGFSCGSNNRMKSQLSTERASCDEGQEESLGRSAALMGGRGSVSHCRDARGDSALYSNGEAFAGKEDCSMLPSEGTKDKGNPG